MKVAELIEQLRAMPQDADVRHLWDGVPRTEISLVWFAKGGYVVTADYDEVCYDDQSRPADAPSKKDDPYWCTRKNAEQGTDK